MRRRPMRAAPYPRPEYIGDGTTLLKMSLRMTDRMAAASSGLVELGKMQHYIDRLLTAKDLADAFQVTSQSIHNWVRARGLPALAIPGRGHTEWRFPPAAVIVWAQQNDEVLVIDLLFRAETNAKQALIDRSVISCMYQQQHQ